MCTIYYCVSKFSFFKSMMYFPADLTESLPLEWKTEGSSTIWMQVSTGAFLGQRLNISYQNKISFTRVQVTKSKLETTFPSKFLFHFYFKFKTDILTSNNYAQTSHKSTNWSTRTSMKKFEQWEDPLKPSKPTASEENNMLKACSSILISSLLTKVSWSRE